jgi:methylmalonyl-CoA mutase
MLPLINNVSIISKKIVLKEVEAKINAIYKAKGVERPHYQGDLPVGNNGLGLLLGVTGDQVLPLDL